MDVYNVGLDYLAYWVTNTTDFYWALFSAFTFDRDDDNVTQVLATATEITAVGYARVATTGNTRTVNDTSDRIEYTCSNPSFGTLTTGQNITDIAMFFDATPLSDATAIPIFHHNLGASIDTNFYDPMTIDITAGLVAYIDEA